MENALTSSEPTATATDTAPRNPLMQRLREAAETLLAEFEAAPVPKDHAGIGKAARTLMSLARLIKAVFDDGTKSSPKRQATPVTRMTGDRVGFEGLESALTEVLADVEAEAPLVPPPPLNRQQRRREERLKRRAKPPENRQKTARTLRLGCLGHLRQNPVEKSLRGDFGGIGRVLFAASRSGDGGSWFCGPGRKRQPCRDHLGSARSVFEGLDYNVTGTFGGLYDDLRQTVEKRTA